MAQTACKAQAVCAALRTASAVRPTPGAVAAPIAPARRTAALLPKRSLAQRASRAATVAVQASAGGLPIDLRGEGQLQQPAWHAGAQRRGN